MGDQFEIGDEHGDTCHKEAHARRSTLRAPTVRCALMASAVEALACHLEYARELSSTELKAVASPPPGKSAMDHTRTILSFGLCPTPNS